MLENIVNLNGTHSLPKQNVTEQRYIHHPSVITYSLKAFLMHACEVVETKTTFIIYPTHLSSSARFYRVKILQISSFQEVLSCSLLDFFRFLHQEAKAIA